jgi:hypothetical protein
VRATPAYTSDTLHDVDVHLPSYFILTPFGRGT